VTTYGTSVDPFVRKLPETTNFVPHVARCATTPPMPNAMLSPGIVASETPSHWLSLPTAPVPDVARTLEMILPFQSVIRASDDAPNEASEVQLEPFQRARPPIGTPPEVLRAPQA